MCPSPHLSGRRDVEVVATHRQKVKEEIAKDRAERAAREKKAKAESAGAAPAAQPQSTAPQAKKEYDTCRLQVRPTALYSLLLWMWTQYC